jgi:hypothetical protein
MFSLKKTFYTLAGFELGSAIPKADATPLRRAARTF